MAIRRKYSSGDVDTMIGSPSSDSTRNPEQSAQPLIDYVKSTGFPKMDPKPDPPGGRKGTIAPQELLEKLYARTCRMQDANFATAAWYNRLHQSTGLPSVILSAIVSTAVFASLSEAAALWLQLLTGALAVLASVGIASVTFLRFSEKAEQYRQAGAKYASLKREVELMSAFPPDNLEQSLLGLIQQWNALNAEAQVIPDRIWSKFANKDYSSIGLNT